MKSTICLFKALPIKTRGKKQATEELLKKTIERGFIFSPEIVANYSNYDELIELVEKEIGLTKEQLNSSFHKSWGKIKEANIEQLVIEQLAHYLTTYGKKNPEKYLEQKEEQDWGVENVAEKIEDLEDFEIDKVGSDYIYIPAEKLEIPEIDIDKIKLTIIRGYTKKELKDKLLKLLKSGVALSEDTIKDMVEVALLVELSEKEISQIRNKEVSSVLYDYLNKIPEDPIEFLRFCIYKSIQKTLLIKDPETFTEIQSKQNINIIQLFQKYDKENGLVGLAGIFYRFKPIFLAFRTNNQLKKIINHIRRLARRHHQPMEEDYLGSLTSKIKRGEIIDEKILETGLKKVNIFRKIRLAYALKFRTKDVSSILYRIRNGKGWAKEFSFNKQSEAKRVLQIVLNSLIRDIKKNAAGKKIYIPENINYTLPATEKMFTGNIPSGSYVSVPKDMIFGVHWKNVKGQMIDLDLSLISADAGKIGWDADYRSEARDILFSGDITDAPNGATELFYIKRQRENAAILFVNYYNYNEDIEVPFKILVAQEQASNFRANYMVNPNHIIAATNSKIIQQQKVLGLLVAKTAGCRFYFTETYLGRSISSSESEFAENCRKYLFDFYVNTIDLRDILEKAEAKFVGREKCEIDLSPENLEKDSILNLLAP